MHPTASNNHFGILRFLFKMDNSPLSPFRMNNKPKKDAIIIAIRPLAKISKRYQSDIRN